MPSTQRLVRRRPLLERIKAYLDPYDFLLWLSEEIETSDWEQCQESWSLPLGIGMNLLMLVSRANSKARSSSAYDDVFGDISTSAGWRSWLATSLVYMLSFISLANAVYTFSRKRHYRMFESSVETQLSSPSAHRVKVQSSPMSSSPLRHLSRAIASDTAASRAHPDSRKDVWELSIWDPLPVCLKMFCLFSPGHVLIYWLFLPTLSTDPRPSTTVLTTLVLAALLSLQLYVLQSRFSQQCKDTTLLHKEVLHEYDTKYVHPRTQRRMRDVGTQHSTRDRSSDGVESYTPVTVVNKGFQTHANPNYQSHVDPDGVSVGETPSRTAVGPKAPIFSPNLRDFSSPVLPHSALRQPQYRASTGGTSDGGNLGVYSHAQSPLRKSASTTFPANQSIRRVQGSPIRRESGRF